MQDFHYNALPIDVYFGVGRSSQVKDIFLEQGYRRVLVITTSGHEEIGKELSDKLGNISRGVYPHAVMHVPVEVADKAVKFVRDSSIDCCLALGGGSTIGLAKAIALKTHLPIVAIPTTYAGSEMTSIYGITDNHRKTIGKDVNVLPKIVIYDPELYLTLPAQISACSGMNAMAHAIESLYAKDKNPIVSMMAIESIKAIKSSLPIIIRDLKNIPARQQVAYGAWLAGVCLGSVGMAIHHKICHVLGGTFNLPHAEAHAITLAYSVHYNRNADIRAMDKLAEALDVRSREEIGLAIYRLNRSLGIRMALKEIGLPEEGPDKVARIVCDSPYYNPRDYNYEELKGLLGKAYEGVPPV
ncbi:maleylacetate reductase [Psychrobacter sp. APC 3426]|uniref:maleylacetate reductase n=1 Tax=Psychrobacter sp. APC 3426 TaxID=3035177 RepID=UPI0025B622B6|nr:maleylacetate reductase [Psychrobacter sp. APC 3426]MDN3399424.1 maleylacetate reductase [Psychrobacter sp. APC 3426]